MFAGETQTIFTVLKTFMDFNSPVLIRLCSYLLWRVFAGEHPGPVGIHGQVPTSWRTAVQGGPGDDGPAHMAERVLFREGRRGTRGTELVVDIWLIISWIILWGVVLLR